MALEAAIVVAVGLLGAIAASARLSVSFSAAAAAGYQIVDPVAGRPGRVIAAQAIAPGMGLPIVATGARLLLSSLMLDLMLLLLLLLL